ncbi:MAG: alpha/beta fold hydrolase [Anaerolineae bacterium]|nr:alpha/beta fold hydrolase [Anaerolineae bacterium]
MPYAETARETLFYTRSPGPVDGPTLVLVHGAGGTRVHWPAELRRLSGATVYTLDLPGHGRSGGQGHGTIEAYAEAVAAFLDTVGIEQAVVAGHSMGGAIAMTLALNQAPSPEPGQARVVGLVLVATGARLRVAPAILEGIRSDFEGIVQLITRFAWSPDAAPPLTELGRQALREASPDILWADFMACDRFDVMERLGEIAVPTLVIGGCADQLAPVKYTRFLGEHIPGASIVTIEDAGHMVMLERPAETAKAVGEFLLSAFR